MGKSACVPICVKGTLMGIFVKTSDLVAVGVPYLYALICLVFINSEYVCSHGFSS